MLAHTLTRFTFSVTVTDEQLAVEAMLDCFEDNLHGYVSRQVVEFPDTITLYVDAYPKNVRRFLLDVADYGGCDQYIDWGT